MAEALLVTEDAKVLLDTQATRRLPLGVVGFKDEERPRHTGEGLFNAGDRSLLVGDRKELRHHCCCPDMANLIQ